MSGISQKRAYQAVCKPTGCAINKAIQLKGTISLRGDVVLKNTDAQKLGKWYTRKSGVIEKLVIALITVCTPNITALARQPP